LKDGNVSPKDSPLTPPILAELLNLIREGTISIKIGKEIFPELCKGGSSPRQLVEQKGLLQISDESAIIATIDQVIERFPKEVADFRGGKEKLLGFFVGQVMKETKGKANPKLLNELLVRRLKG
jgi:aspartyl-tRNA(Asn)/glutamyl-tRNA(Gln) amidotransferase subunit B